MATNRTAWLLGTAVGAAGILLINQRFVKKYQDEMLFSLRKAISHPGHIESMVQEERLSQPVTISFFSRETLNLALISISDRFINKNSSE
jgi:hypothetical protein